MLRLRFKFANAIGGRHPAVFFLVGSSKSSLGGFVQEWFEIPPWETPLHHIMGPEHFFGFFGLGLVTLGLVPI
jgi:hypothetical protein